MKKSGTKKTISAQKPTSQTPTKPNFFAKILAIISILGFFSIVTETFFGIMIDQYLEATLLLLMGIGFLYESQPVKLLQSLPSHFQEQSFASIVTFVIGTLALIVGVLALPQINLQNPTLNAINGIIAIVAILFIVIETWVIK